MESAIKSTKLKGHRGPVTCLDHSSSHLSMSSTECMLLSGSEDGSCRLWDLREHRRASMCIQVPSIDGESIADEVLSVSFAPPTKVTKLSLDDNTEFARDFSVYVSAGSIFYGYDLRNALSPVVILKEKDVIFRAEEEINQIAVPNLRQGQSQVLAAIADDAGFVSLIDENVSNGPRTLLHNGQALATSAVFRPNYHRALQIATGGTDCKVMLWDTAKPKKAIDSVIIQSLTTDANQICNPPMVNSLAWSPTGKMLAAALGDGSCAILLVSDNRTLVLASRLEDAHSGPVASAIFPRWSSPSEPANSVDGLDRLLCTAGNDGNLVLWDLGSSLCDDKAVDPRSLFEGIKPPNDDINDFLGQPSALFAWKHSDAKPNWMLSSGTHDSYFPSAIFIADTTNDITIYNIPLA